LAESVRTTILLIDDEEIVRAGLAMLLDAEPDLEIVGELAKGELAVELASRLAPDVVIVDLRMPGIDGVETIRRLASDDALTDAPHPFAVLALTTFNEDEAVLAAVRAGASGFLLKSAAPRELVSAVRALAAGNAWLDPLVAKTIVRDVATRTSNGGRPGPSVLPGLTSKEREVLGLMAHGLTNTAIASHLVISIATVKTHVSRILVKLGLHDRSQAVVMAYQCGLVLPGDSSPI
jgi:DNA-binding NarL/FixJ family response regulator